MRLIDADELIERRPITRTQRVFNYETNEMMEIKETIGERIYVTFEEIENAPTIEAEPIRHGGWIKRYTDGFCNGVRNYEMICPFCDYSYLDNHVGVIVPEYFNYCPNCGAKMNAQTSL